MQNYTLLDYFRDEMSLMFESTLDDINENDEPMIKYINGRIDRIQKDVSDAMYDKNMMEFMSMFYLACP